VFHGVVGFCRIADIVLSVSCVVVDRSSSGTRRGRSGTFKEIPDADDVEDPDRSEQVK
jgi:hypothetical protein